MTTDKEEINYLSSLVKSARDEFLKALEENRKLKLKVQELERILEKKEQISRTLAKGKAVKVKRRRI